MELDYNLYEDSESKSKQQYISGKQYIRIEKIYKDM